MLSRRLFCTLPFAALAAQAKQVRITGIDIYNIRIPVTKDEAKAGLNHAYTVVEVSTDAGVKGFSFSGPPPSQLPAVRQLLVGRDLFAIEKHLDDGLEKWGGVEHALWDAIGRIAKQPVHRLLGGGGTRVKAYVTCVLEGQDRSAAHQLPGTGRPGRASEEGRLCRHEDSRLAAESPGRRRCLRGDPPCH